MDPPIPPPPPVELIVSVFPVGTIVIPVPAENVTAPDKLLIVDTPPATADVIITVAVPETNGDA
jgi:hypothetical protein